MRFRVRRIASMAVVAVVAWIIVNNNAFRFIGRPLPVIILIAVALGFGIWFRPTFAERVFNGLARLRRPRHRTVVIATFAIAILSSVYFFVTAWVQGRYLPPHYHDDCVYAIQAQMFRIGRLWMPPHPMGDFFDTFYLLMTPKYVAQYFPGTALMYTPGLWVGLPTWVMPLIVSGAAVGFTYCVITELIDGLAGALAVAMHIGTFQVRQQSIAFTAQPVILLLSLLAVWAWLRWRKQHHLRWVAALGVIMGWAAVTRPIDALCIAIPIVLAMLFEMRKSTLRQWVRTAAVGIAAGTPLLAVQVVLNYGTSGAASVSPFQIYADRDNPGTMLGFHKYDPSLRPVSKIAEKRMFYDQWMMPYIRLHQPQILWRIALRDRLPLMVSSAMASPLLFALVPLGLVGAWRPNRAVFAASLLLFFSLYLLYTFFLSHYCLTVTPGLIFLSLLGLWRLLAQWRLHRQVAVPIAVLVVLVICAGSLPQLNGYSSDGPELDSISRAAEKLTMVKKPAVVLFKFDPQSELHSEPVYNTDVAWPDDAPVIRAHDLGARNPEIFRYYANLQPGRNFYIYNERTEMLTHLGTAAELTK